MTILSASDLARLLDRLEAEEGAFITEDQRCVVVSALSAASAKRLAQCCSDLLWGAHLEDSEHNPFSLEEALREEWSPFRVSFEKPPGPDPKALYLLSARGFGDWLERGHDAVHWRLASFRKPLVTQCRLYTDWEAKQPFAQAPQTCSPRRLVREISYDPQVPADIRCWLLAEYADIDLADPLHRLWASKAFDALARSLADELYDDTGLLFSGPPPLRLRLAACAAQSPAPGTFGLLQEAARWVYQSRREAEPRHRMLASEIARMARADGGASEHFAAHLAAALEGAKAGYRIYLSGITLDSLKMLAQLRSSALDENAKVAESTQKAVAGSAVGLSVVLGTYLAQLDANLRPWTATLLIACAIGYSAKVVWSNGAFIRLQRQQRLAFHTQLYRFLPSGDYQNMVRRPAKRSGWIYKRTAVCGLAMVVVLGITIIAAGFLNDSLDPPAPKYADACESSETEPSPSDLAKPPGRLLWSTQIIDDSGSSPLQKSAQGLPREIVERNLSFTGSDTCRKM